MQRASLVSIGIPTFNRVGTLRQTIESALAQDYGNLEILISDNASSDNTQALCEEFSKRDCRIEYVRQATNRGAFANFVDVLDRASGEYFMWLGDDDRLSRSYVTRCVETLQTRGDVALVCGIAHYQNANAISFMGAKVDLQQEQVGKRVLSFYGKVNDNGTFYGLARRRTLLENPMQNILGGDWLLVARLAAAGKIVTLDDIMIYRSSNGASADVSTLALRMGFSNKRARQPHNSIALSVARDILRPSLAFARLGVGARLLLAIRSADIVQRRFVSGNYPVRSFAIRLKARFGRLRSASRG